MSDVNPEGFDPNVPQFNPPAQQPVATVTTQVEVPTQAAGIKDTIINTTQDILPSELPNMNDPMFIKFSRSSAIYILDVVLLVNFAIVPLVQLYRHELIAVPTLPEPFYTLGEIFFGLYVTGRVYEKYKGVKP